MLRRLDLTSICHFNPRPPWGGRRSPWAEILRKRHFNPRPPWGGRRHKGRIYRDSLNISIHALRGEGDSYRAKNSTDEAISIHALRGEGDWHESIRHRQGLYFNPRPPWGGRRSIVQHGEYHYDFNPRPPWGGRPFFNTPIQRNTKFQSTPSVGRATLEQHRQKHRSRNISIHALRGEGDDVRWNTKRLNSISIHALRGEGDDCVPIATLLPFDFNPRPPWGGRPKIGWLSECTGCISIHALRGEGDKVYLTRLLRNMQFQSTPSVGRATRATVSLLPCREFQSTPSVGRATQFTATRTPMFKRFQSTPSVGRATSVSSSSLIILFYFNPRPPWGGRLVKAVANFYGIKFQSTPSVGRATRCRSYLF